MITASLAGIVETFGGSVVTGGISAENGDFLLVVGAMSQESFSHRLESHEASQIVLFVGDRENIQFCAIRAKVRAIVVTGGLAVIGFERSERVGAYLLGRWECGSNA